MATRMRFFAAFTVTLLLSGSVWSESQRKPQSPESMSPMISACRVHLDAMSKIIAEAQKAVTRAKDSSDRAIVRPTLDQMQISLIGMKEHTNACNNALNMMQKMQTAIDRKK